MGSWNLGLASAAMVALGYPGEIQDDPQGRFGWWACAMLPFMYVVYTLLAGLNAATDKQPESAKGLIVAARYLTAISWLTYPGVYMIKMVGLAGPVATTYEQVGYSIADMLPRRCLASSFGPSRRPSPRRRRARCWADLFRPWDVYSECRVAVRFSGHWLPFSA